MPAVFCVQLIKSGTMFCFWSRNWHAQFFSKYINYILQTYVVDTCMTFFSASVQTYVVDTCMTFSASVQTCAVDT